jgi:hypothetical protein
VKILREAMAKTFKDPGFQQDFKKLMGREPTPLTGEEVEKAVRELPRDAEVIALYKPQPTAAVATAIEICATRC